MALAGDGRTFLKTGYIIPSLSTMNSNYHRIRLISFLLPVNGEYDKEKRLICHKGKSTALCLEKTGEMCQPKQAKIKYINGQAFFKSFPVKLKIRPKNMAITKAMSAM